MSTKKAATEEAPATATVAAVAATGNTWGFNPNQLASYDQARALRDYLHQNNIGRGLPMGDDEDGMILAPNLNFPWLPPVPMRVGIYLPSWEGGPGAFAIPHGTGPNGEKLQFLHFRFNNGKEGVNVGLCLDKFRRYPGQNAYVLSALADDIGR